MKSTKTASTREMAREIPKEMSAARVAERGGSLSLARIPVPSPLPGQILIRVEAAGVNFADVKRRRGDVYPFETAFPYVPGGEVAGTVVAHGPGVEGPEIGARVFALAGADGQGGYAQYAVSYAATAVPMPPALSFEAASVLLVAGTTAQLVLTEVARLRQGETVFIPAATGGVGSFAVQIARRLGAKVIAGVGGANKAAAALALGAHHAVDTGASDWPSTVRAITEGAGVDVALEATGEGSLEATLSCLRSFGRLVVYGAASGRAASLSPQALERWLYAPALNQSISAFNLGSFFMERPQVAGAALGSIVEAALREQLRIPPITTLPLSEAAAAQQRLESRLVSGKLVLLPWT